MVRQLNAAVCHGVVVPRQNGQKQKAIARFYHISQGAVNKILQRNAVTGVPTPMPRPGRPIKTTRRQDRLLVRLCTGGRTQPTSSLRTQWQNAIGIRVSRTLVNGRLVRTGYRARRPLRKPLLKQNHRQRRLQWARDHLRLQQHHWNHVVYSDEAIFEVYRHDGRIRVRRRVEELYHETCRLPRVQAGGGGITVWGAVHAYGKSDLIILDDNLDQHKYRRILEQTMLPFARATFLDNFEYQDANAPAHRARTELAQLPLS